MSNSYGIKNPVEPKRKELLDFIFGEDCSFYSLLEEAGDDDKAFISIVRLEYNIDNFYDDETEDYNYEWMEEQMEEVTKIYNDLGWAEVFESESESSTSIVFYDERFEGFFNAIGMNELGE